MRAPIIPGKKADDTDQREAMLRRLGIAEEKPRTASRWDVLARDLEPAAPVQTPPPTVGEIAVEQTLPAHQPIPMTETRRYEPEPEPAAEPEEAVVVQASIQPIRVEQPAPEPEPIVEAPVARAPEPEPEPAMESASFMPGWGEEDIPEDDGEGLEEPEAVVEAAPPADAVVHRPHWMDERLAEAPRRDEILPKMERAVSYSAPAEPVANDEDLAIPPAPKAASAMEAPAARAPGLEEIVSRQRVSLSPAPGPVVDAPVARQPEPMAEARQPITPPALEPVVEAPVAKQPAPPPAPEPVVEPEPAPVETRKAAPEPVVEAPAARKPAAAEPEPAAPPVDAALQQMRAELEAMRKQFQTAPAPAPAKAPETAMPLAAAIPYEGRRSKSKTDFFANARMVVWTLAIVAALWVTYHAWSASAHHKAREDHIMATVTGKDAAADEATATDDETPDAPATTHKKRRN